MCGSSCSSAHSGAAVRRRRSRPYRRRGSARSRRRPAGRRWRPARARASPARRGKSKLISTSASVLPRWEQVQAGGRWEIVKCQYDGSRGERQEFRHPSVGPMRGFTVGGTATMFLKGLSARGPITMATPPQPNPPSALQSLGRALAHRNYRLFFAGQGVSLIGTWMTRLASGWLVYRLAGENAAWLLGLVGFAGLAPAF